MAAFPAPLSLTSRLSCSETSKNTSFCKTVCFCRWSSANRHVPLEEEQLPGRRRVECMPRGHMRSPSSASSAAAISSASELPPSSSSQLDAPLDSLAASSSFSFLLWPLQGKHTHREMLVAHTLPGPSAASPHASGTALTAQAGHQGSLRLRQVTKYPGCVRAGEGGARSKLGGYGWSWTSRWEGRRGQPPADGCMFYIQVYEIYFELTAEYISDRGLRLIILHLDINSLQLLSHHLSKSYVGIYIRPPPNNYYGLGKPSEGKKPPQKIYLLETQKASSSHRHTRDWENDVQDCDVYNLRPVTHTEISTTDKE